MTNGANSPLTRVIVVDRIKLLKSNISAVSMPLVMPFFVNFEGSRHGEFWLMVGYYRAIENCLEELFEELLNFAERKFVNTAVNA